MGKSAGNPWKDCLKTLSIFLFCACTVMGGAVGYVQFRGYLETGKWLQVSQTSEEEKPTPIFVIDAGHGGEDGGAAGADGTAEKDLNLEIALTMYDMAALLGYPVSMTRTEDTLLYDRYGDLDDYTGKKKTYDLRNRLRFAEESGAAVFCSIHMNKFADARYKGLQVYYSPNHTASQAYATLIQSYARTFLDPENTREIKKASSSIYLLHRIRTPAVLVECGFLSNPEECARLHTEAYRLQVSATVLSALIEGWRAGVGA